MAWLDKAGLELAELRTMWWQLLENKEMTQAPGRSFNEKYEALKQSEKRPFPWQEKNTHDVNLPK